jgi:hypothetical protein
MIYITSDFGIIGGDFAINWRNKAQSFFIFFGKSCVWVNKDALRWNLRGKKGSIYFKRIDLNIWGIDLCLNTESAARLKPCTIARTEEHSNWSGYYFYIAWLYWELEGTYYL